MDRGMWYYVATPYISTSLVAQMVKNLPVMQETWVQTQVRKIPLRREWQSTPVFLPGKSHGQRSLVDYSPWGHKELDTTYRLNNKLFYSFLYPTRTPLYSSAFPFVRSLHENPRLKFWITNPSQSEHSTNTHDIFYSHWLPNTRISGFPGSSQWHFGTEETPVLSETAGTHIPDL